MSMKAMHAPLRRPGGKQNNPYALAPPATPSFFAPPLSFALALTLALAFSCARSRSLSLPPVLNVIWRHGPGATTAISMAEARAFDELLHETCDGTEAHLLRPGDTLLIAAPDYWVQTYTFSSYFTGDP